MSALLPLFLTFLLLLAPAPPSQATPATAVDAARSPSRKAPAPPEPAPTGGRMWPVGAEPRILRGWEPPASDYGPGHRGVDLAAPPGVPVRAAGAGRVSFAGEVAGRGVVSIELSGTGEPPLRTTYVPVRARVSRGDRVAVGAVVGTLQPGAHCPSSCLHWGLLRGDRYLDPLTLLPPHLLRRGPSRLLPVIGVPYEPGDGTGDGTAEMTTSTATSTSAEAPGALAGQTHAPDVRPAPARPPGRPALAAAAADLWHAAALAASVGWTRYAMSRAARPASRGRYGRSGPAGHRDSAARLPLSGVSPGRRAAPWRPWPP